MATDGEKVYFSPQYMRGLNSDQLTGLVAHEVMHVAMKHHERRGGRNAKRWQRACDFAINPSIIDSGLSLPEGYLDCELYHGKSAEEIYAMMPEGEDGGDQGEGGGQEPQQPKDKQSPSEGQQPPMDPGTLGEVLDRPKNSPASATGEAWEGAMTQAARAADKAGKLPASLKRMIDEILHPTLPWETLLRRFMTSVSRDDFDWMRPNRRFIGQGLYLPGSYSERMEHMVVAIDTSGSIDQPLLESFIAEVNGILQEVDCGKVTLLQCSNKLGETKAFLEGNPLTTDHIVGGGGTSFNPVFDWLKANGHDVECLVYFTDLKVRIIPENPGIPVMWAEPGNTRGYTKDPKYGQRVKIKEREVA